MAGFCFHTFLSLWLNPSLPLSPTSCAMILLAVLPGERLASTHHGHDWVRTMQTLTTVQATGLLLGTFTGLKESLGRSWVPVIIVLESSSIFS